jgi:hypothetical protein
MCKPIAGQYIVTSVQTPCEDKAIVGLFGLKSLFASINAFEGRSYLYGVFDSLVFKPGINRQVVSNASRE